MYILIHVKHIIISLFFDLVQLNLSKPDLIGLNFCVRNRRVFGLYKLN